MKLFFLVAALWMSTDTLAVKMRSSSATDEDYLTTLGKSGATLHDSMLNFIQGVSASTDIEEAEGLEPPAETSSSFLWNFLQEGSEAGVRAVADTKPILNADQGPTLDYHKDMDKCAKPLLSMAAVQKQVFDSRFFGDGKCVYPDAATRPTALGRLGMESSCYAHIDGKRVYGKNGEDLNYMAYMEEVWCPENKKSCTLKRDGDHDCACAADFSREVLFKEQYRCTEACKQIENACTAVPGCAIWKTPAVDMCIPQAAIDAQDSCHTMEYRMVRGQEMNIKKAAGSTFKETCLKASKAWTKDGLENPNCVPDIMYFDTNGGVTKSDPVIDRTPRGGKLMISEATESASNTMTCRPLSMLQAMLVFSRCDPRNVGNALYNVKDWEFINNWVASFMRMDLCVEVAGFLLAKYGINIDDWPIPNFLKPLLKPILNLIAQGLDFVGKSSGKDLSLTIRFDQFGSGDSSSLFSQWVGGGGSSEPVEEEAEYNEQLIAQRRRLHAA